MNLMKRVEMNDPLIQKLNEGIDTINMLFRMVDELKTNLQELDKEFTDYVMRNEKK